ncbi:MAG: hypothetical protein AB7O96_01010 [Pseudobdellovibrionaceae bacterium]
MELIVGWKGIMQQLHKFGADFNMRTIKEWHYKRMPIPFQKTYQIQQGRVYIEKEQLQKWLREVVLMPKRESAQRMHKDSI